MRLHNLLLLWSLANLLLFSSCHKDVDNPRPDGQHGTVTTLQLVLTDSSAFPVQRDTFVFDDPDGAGGQQPIRWDTLRLQSAKTYRALLLLTNRLSNPPQELNPLIKAQGTQHLLLYHSDTALLRVQITDMDQFNLPLGLESLWYCGNRLASGTLEINLRHIAFGKNINSNANSGHSDVQVIFPLQIQP